MTKINIEKVKCIECGEESNQSVIYSINPNIDMKELKELRKTKQECPFCGYKAKDISKQKLYIFLKNRLYRKVPK